MNGIKITKLVFFTFILLAIALFIYTYTVPEGYLDEGYLHPMTYPRVLLIIIGILCAVNAFTKQVSIDMRQFARFLPSMFGLLGSLTVFMVLLPYLGFLISSIIMSFLILCVLDYSKIIYRLIISISVCTFFWYIFKSVIYLPLPIGSLVNL